MATTGQKLLLATPTLIVAESVAALAHGGGLGAIVAAGAAGLAYAYADDLHTALFRGATPEGEAEAAEETPAQRRESSLGYRLLNGKSTRVQSPEAQAAEPQPEIETGEDDFGTPLLSGDAFTFSQVLASGWRPSYGEIFLVRLANGTDVFLPVEHLVHIALAGATRQGKTSIIRQLLAQLCAVGCCCILLDPHYTPYDIETEEDWTPFTPYLRFDPLTCKSYERIEQILRHAATTLLDLRKRRREQMQPVGTPTFFVIDEYPAIIAEKPDVQKHVAKVLREGAKYKLFLCVASQDFQVKTVSPQAGGAIRDNYKTCLYVGGDPATARVLLDTSVPQAVEARLGKGPVLVRCAVVKEAALAHTPLTDNEALYRLLGPSTYQPVTASQIGQDDDPLAEHYVTPETDLLDDTVATPLPKEATSEKTVVPILADRGRQAEEIDLRAAIAVYNTGATSRYQLAKIFGLSENQGRKLKELIEEQAKQGNG